MKQASLWYLASGPSGNVLRSQREDSVEDPGLGPGLQGPGSLESVGERAAPEGRRSEFVAVTGEESQQTSATGLVVAAYSLFWLLALALVWVTFRGQERLRARIEAMESKLPKDRLSQ
ncbi:MAG: hypothetical protein QM784_14435 [Polyangiaceae bacterium]